METMNLGVTPLQVSFSDGELRMLVLNYIENHPEGVGFKDICNHVLAYAQEQGKLREKSDKEYQWVSLDRADVNRLSAVITREIVAGSMSIDFDKSHDTDDYYFISNA